MAVKRKLLAALLSVGWTCSPGAQAVSDGLTDPDKSFQLVEETSLAKGFKAYGGHWQVENGVLFVNPGSASHPRLRQPPTVAIVEIHPNSRLEVRWLTLD